MGRARRYTCVVDKKFYFYNASHMRIHTRYYKSHVTSEHTTEWNCRFVWWIISITEQSYSGKIFLGSTRILYLCPYTRGWQLRLRYKLLSSQCSDHWATIIRQPPAHTILSICCRSGTECSSLTPGSPTPIRKILTIRKETHAESFFFHFKWLEASCFSWKYWHLCSTHGITRPLVCYIKPH